LKTRKGKFSPQFLMILLSGAPFLPLLSPSIAKEIGNGSLSVSGMHTLHDGRTEALAPFALRR
jgi:hypothetical protein